MDAKSRHSIRRVAGFMRALGVLVIGWPLLTGGSCDRTAEGAKAPADPPATRTQRAAGQGERPLHFSGRVVAVGDGDTINVLADEASADAARPADRQRDRRPIRVRLVEIDCPELGQPFGRKARQAASSLCFGRTVRVAGTGMDTFGRVLGVVTLDDGRILNEELVRLGYAWWFRKYSRSETLQALEAEARAGRVGLWADRDPVPPWQWRDRSRNR